MEKRERLFGNQPVRNVIEHPQPLAAFSADMLLLADQYLESFVALDVKSYPDRIHPAYFLVTHATELALKAFITHRGHSYQRTVDIGHQLPKLLAKALELDLREVPKLSLLVDRLSDMNIENSLRYPAFKFMSVPDAEECTAVAKSLIDALRPRVQTAGAVSMLTLRARYPGSDFAWTGDPA